MATAHLRVLEEYSLDTLDYFDFTDDLELWCRQYEPGIAFAVASRSRDIFDDKALRMLVRSWAHEKRLEDELASMQLHMAMRGELDDKPAPSEYAGHSLVAAFDASLYRLLVEA